MPSLFSGIHMALQSLLAHQQAMQVIEHNVANANTPGYSRQEAILKPGSPYPATSFIRAGLPGQIGTGVLVDRVQRFHNEFVDERLRDENALFSRWSVQEQLLRHIEIALNETQTDGLLAKLDLFWEGWRSLSTDPSNHALRLDLLERSKSLAMALQNRAQQLRTIRAEQDLEISQRVAEINRLADLVARLNAEIANVISVGDQPNDLMDQRDLALSRLAALAGADSHIQSNGDVMVSIGGHALVTGTSTFELQALPDPSNNNLIGITWSDGQSYAGVNGELAGLLAVRDGILVDRLNALDDFASALASRVNEIHRNGFGLNDATGLDFFTGSDALTLRVNDVLDSTENIAAAGSPMSPGDGSVAEAIADVRTERLMTAGTATLDQFYSGELVTLGLEIQKAERLANDRQLVLDSLGMQKESLAGVSLDEEAAKMIQSQRAFQAASRLMTTLDEMLDRIINRMGRVGI